MKLPDLPNCLKKQQTKLSKIVNCSHKFEYLMTQIVVKWYLIRNTSEHYIFHKGKERILASPVGYEIIFLFKIKLIAEKV